MAEMDEPDHRRQLRDSVADFVARAVNPRDLRADLASPAGFSPARWRAMADLGWTGLLIPDSLGGLAMEHGDLAALHEETGRAALPEPLAVVPLLAGGALAGGSNPALAERAMPGLLAGETLASFAWQGGAGAMGAADVGPTAEPADGGWRLSGEAAFVPFAGTATALVTAARTGSGVALFWLEGGWQVRDPVRHADGSPQETVVFDTPLGADALIAGPETGGALLETLLDTARLAAAAELLGCSERAFAMTLDHLRGREQFGRPIGTFQALQHRAVDLHIQIELARSALGRAVQALDAGAPPPERAAQVSAAKSRCGETARRVMNECIQLHGAIGYTEEYDLSLYVNRAIFLAAWLGNPRAHRARWAALQGFGGTRHAG